MNDLVGGEDSYRRCGTVVLRAYARAKQLSSDEAIAVPYGLCSVFRHAVDIRYADGAEAQQ